MNKKDLRNLIEKGESSSVEFKRDERNPKAIAKEIAAMLNFQGGYLLLGVEDDGSLSGMIGTAKRAEEHIVNLCSQNIDPPFIPHWQSVVVDGRNVGVVSIPDDAPDKPYKAKSGSKWQTYIRMGTSSREATREQEARLYHASPLGGSYVVKPVINASMTDLDMRRVYDYFDRIRETSVPSVDQDDEWSDILFNSGLLAESYAEKLPTIASILLFGKDPRRYLKNSGVSACAYDGTDKSAAAKEITAINAPMIPLFDAKKRINFPGIVEYVLDFVKRNIQLTKNRNNGRREEEWDYPIKAVREAAINALIHRDYTMPADIELSIYPDRLEIVSPGTLPNRITVERMKHGCRASRNEVRKDIMRDYKYVEDMGMGVRYTIIPQMMKYNGTEPCLVEEDERFKIILYKKGDGAK